MFFGIRHCWRRRRQCLLAIGGTAGCRTTTKDTPIDHKGQAEYRRVITIITFDSLSVAIAMHVSVWESEIDVNNDLWSQLALVNNKHTTSSTYVFCVRAAYVVDKGAT
jgi:hypothetical protein